MLIHDPKRSSITSDDKDDQCQTIADGDRAAECVSQCEAPAEPCVDGAWPRSKGRTPEIIKKYFAAIGAKQQPAAPSSAEQQPVAPSSCQRHQAAASGDGQQPAAQNGEQKVEQKVAEWLRKGRSEQSDEESDESDAIGGLWNHAFGKKCIESQIKRDGTRVYEDSQPYFEDSQLLQ